jgi:hypothetical protein
MRARRRPRGGVTERALADGRGESMLEATVGGGRGIPEGPMLTDAAGGRIVVMVTIIRCAHGAGRDIQAH